MAHHRAAALSISATLWLGGCEAFYALGPNGCDDTHACMNPERPRCDVAARRCLPAAADLGPDAGEEPLCRDHDDCASGVCDQLGLITAEPGRCVPERDVAHVETAAELQAALPSYGAVRLAPGAYEGDWVIALRSVIMVGKRPRSAAEPWAQLLPIASGAVVRVGTRARLMLDGVSVQGGKGSNGHGIVCETGDGRLVLRRSEVTGNAGRGVWARCPTQITQSRIGGWAGTGNSGGGVVAEDALSLTNSFITYNGTAFSDFGGVGLVGAPMAVRELVHLTVISNQRVGDGSAVDCQDAAVQIWRSILFDQRLTHPILAGHCQIRAAAVDSPELLQPGSVHLGPANPPLFHGLFDFHLRPGSPAQDTVPVEDLGPRLAVDYDGDPRPQGAGYDFGADEVAP